MKKSFLLTLCFALFSALLFAQAEEGLASYYNDSFHGKATASGEKYDKTELTGAHKTLPYGTKVKVTRIDNGKTVIIRINDRGGFTKGHILDLSRAAADAIGLDNENRTKIKMEVIGDKKEDDKAKPANTTLEVQGLYKLQVLKMDAKGWGVQVGIYSSYDSVIKQAAAFQDDWFKNVMVYISGSDEKPSYKLVLGPFLDKPTAESYQKSLKKKHKIESFVIDLAELGK